MPHCAINPEVCLWLLLPSNQKGKEGNDDHADEYQAGEDEPKGTCGTDKFGFSSLRAIQDCHDRALPVTAIISPNQRQNYRKLGHYQQVSNSC
jgi:hypothetical protein